MYEYIIAGVLVAAVGYVIYRSLPSSDEPVEEKSSVGTAPQPDVIEPLTPPVEALASAKAIYEQPVPTRAIYEQPAPAAAPAEPKRRRRGKKVEAAVPPPVPAPEKKQRRRRKDAPAQ